MRKTTILFLKEGDAVPKGQPRRYLKGQRYVRLRWKLGPYLYTEVWEHRVKNGFVVHAESQGYVMVRRKRCIPRVLTVEEWEELHIIQAVETTEAEESNR